MKILIVDDEPGFARQLADGIGAAGGDECFAAASAEEAVEIVNTEGTMDVLVTDVFMDGIDGFTLNETIRPHLPGLRTIFLSEFDLSASADRVGGWPVLAKPVDAATVAGAIRGMDAAQPAAQSAADPLVGAVLGNYRVEALIGADIDGNFYSAVQTNIERAAELHALDPARSTDPDEVSRFLADARTKANVHHPALLSVFEAGQKDSIYFYTSETRNGSSLADLAARGSQLDARTILQLLHSVAEVMVHLSHEKIARQPLDPSHVLIDHRMRTRLVNIATSQPSDVTAVQEMQSLAAMVTPIVAPSDHSQSVHQLLFEMQSESVTLRSWNALLFEVKRCASGAPSPHAHRLDESGRAAIEAVGAARRRQRMMRQAILAGAVLIPLGVAGFWAWKFLKPDAVAAKPEGNPAWETMVKIPAGEFTFQGGKKINLPDFWIDTHEVTIGQYADFLAWANTHPDEAAAIAQDGMPPGHSYVPTGWADEKTADAVKPGIHSIARAGGTYDGAVITLDSPVFGVDWFDACAYAAWKGRRLPGDEEWEKAAIGVNGAKYPWGDEWKLGNANISVEDGFPKWSPVNAVPGDKSPFGVIGAAGNVSEWTFTVTRDDKGGIKPVIRGGNWSDAVLDIRRRQTDLDATQSTPTLGFRTATDKPPQP